MLLLSLRIAAALGGLLSSIILQIRPISTDLAICVEFALLVLLVAFRRQTDLSLVDSLLTSATVVSTHVLAHVLATVLYRVSPLHPLWRFPGPVLNKITSLFNAYKTAIGERHLYVDDLHKRYGRIVRIGPDALSINSVDAIAPIYGGTSTMDKGRAYTFGGARGSGLFFMKAREEHNRRRKIWAPAFSQNVLQTYRQAIDRRARQFIDVIHERCEEHGFVDLGEAIGHFTYDIMGDVTFGASSQVDMLARGDPDKLIRSGQLATTAFEIIGEVPLLFSLLWYFPVSEKMRALEERAGRWMTARQEAGQYEEKKVEDIASHLLAHAGTAQELSPADLRVDGLFAIQAGSDTPAGVLTILYFHLTLNPTITTTLLHELSNAFPTSLALTPTSIPILNRLPYLNAVLSEGLRLGTPFHGFPRVVPQNSKGVLIGEKWFIPGGTTVSVPGWSVHIDEENFGPDPAAFRPERWLEGSVGEGRTNKVALIAFSSGTYGCLGKQFAMDEMMLHVARTVLSCEFSFAPGFDPVKFHEGILNIRTPVFKEKLRVVVRKRDGYDRA